MWPPTCRTGRTSATWDAISGTRPITLHDRSEHSYWVNSAMLRLLGIDRNTPDLSANVSHFARDENGEPTGWVKEFALIPYIGGRPAPDAESLRAGRPAWKRYASSGRSREGTRICILRSKKIGRSARAAGPDGSPLARAVSRDSVG